MTIRRLTTEDFETYRRVRLAALREAPGAFGSTFAGESRLTEADWVRRLANEMRAVFVAEDDGEVLGLAAGAPDDEDPKAGFLVSMWVHPRARGRGHGDALVQTVLRWLAASGCELVRLHVTEGNDPAAELYRRNGFALSGHQLRRDRDEVLELEMVRDPRQSASAAG
jgi:ribosomal protein S18 acetylase RimI-like enzyme